MEKKLKKQKRKLIFRVSIILFAVWLAVSAVYGIIRFNSEKQKIKNNVNIELQLNTVRNINAISGTGIPAAIRRPFPPSLRSSGRARPCRSAGTRRTLRTA